MPRTMQTSWDIAPSNDADTQEVLRNLQFLEKMISASRNDPTMKEVFEDKARQARADLMVVKRSSAFNNNNKADSNESRPPSTLDELSSQYVPSTGFPRMGQYLRVNFGIIEEEEEKDDPPTEVEDDQEALQAALKEAVQARDKQLTLRRLAYQWFCMDAKLQVLHDLYPCRWVVPLWQDISKELSRRWKALPQERKEHYREIAEYQIDKEAEEAKTAATEVVSTPPDSMKSVDSK